MKKRNQTLKNFVSADKFKTQAISQERIYNLRGLLFRNVSYSQLLKSGYTDYEIKIAYELNRNYLRKKFSNGNIGYGKTHFYQLNSDGVA